MLNKGELEMDNAGNVKVTKKRPARGKSPMRNNEADKK